MVCKILSAWELWVKSYEIRTYGWTEQLANMPEGGWLARAAGALVSACGLVGEETQISFVLLSMIVGKGADAGKDVGHRGV